MCGPERVNLAGSDPPDAHPVPNTALQVGVVSYSDRSAVILKPNGVGETCGDLDDVRPAAIFACVYGITALGTVMCPGL